MISTHTLTWSVTRSYLWIKIVSNFNSHAHVERDLLCYNAELAGARISTHTLTWSVTMFDQTGCAGIAISTHTLTWSVTLAHVAV